MRMCGRRSCCSGTGRKDGSLSKRRCRSKAATRFSDGEEMLQAREMDMLSEDQRFTAASKLPLYSARFSSSGNSAGLGAALLHAQ